MPLSSYKFGEFELDCARYEQRRNERVLKLERIPMELLILLAERDGNVVSRQEIIERLWGKDVFVDTEHGVNTAIRKIRAALQEDAERPRFVLTVLGKGHRFVADKNGNPTPLESAQEVKNTDPAEANPSAVLATERRWWPMAIVVTAIGLLAGAALVFNLGGVRDRIFPPSQRARIQSVAVLPLANLSGDASQEYFADGMTDELIAMLAKNTSLRVVSRTSAMQFKGVQRPARDIARELGVDGILEGSVERSGNRVHLTVQLIHAASDTHIWAESYDRDLNGSLLLPSEVSQTIAKEVSAAVLPVKPQRYINPEAHDAYLRGLYFWFRNNNDDARSQEYFEKAIQLQPDYAAAWSGLANAYLVQAVAMELPAQQVMGKAEVAAHKAAELDSSLAEAHNSLAALYFFGDWDLARADAESMRAISLNPNHAEAHHLRAYILEAMNRRDEALREQKRCTELDQFERPWALGKVLMQLRQFDAAVSELRLRAEAQPQDSLTRFLLADAYRFNGMEQESFEEAEQGYLLQGDKKSAAAFRHAFKSGGETAVAEWLLSRSMARARKSYVSPLWLAFQTARLKRKEETLRLLEESYLERSAWLVMIQNDPEFDFLHSDERYRALVKKIGLPPAY